MSRRESSVLSELPLPLLLTNYLIFEYFKTVVRISEEHGAALSRLFVAAEHRSLRLTGLRRSAAKSAPPSHSDTMHPRRYSWPVCVRIDQRSCSLQPLTPPDWLIAFRLGIFRASLEEENFAQKIGILGNIWLHRPDHCLSFGTALRPSDRPVSDSFEFRRLSAETLAVAEPAEPVKIEKCTYFKIELKS